MTRKDDTKKPPLSLVDPDFVESMARVLEYGEQKYGTGNWKGGLAYTRLIDAAARHLAAIQRGEDIDPETGEPHTQHAASCLMFLNWYRNHNLGERLDDRHYKEMPGLRGDQLELYKEPDRPPRLDLPEVQQQEAGGGSTPATDPVEHLQDRIAGWADRVFPHRTPENALQKLVMEEIPELLNGGLDDPHEYADVLILVLDVAKLRGIDAIQAAHEKMTINEARSWEMDESTGLMHHVGDDS